MKATHAFREGLLLQRLKPRFLVLGGLLIAGLCIRLYGVGQPPMDFAGVRQYHSALLARGFYEWLLSGKLKTIPPDGIIEPPILEMVASLSYLISGGEHLFIPRVLSAAFWMVGAAFLYLIARKIMCANAALICVGFYVFDPAVVLPSRAFMPDPLMIMLLMISVFSILRYHEEPTKGRLMVAALASSMALLVKPGILLFEVFGVFVALMVYREGLMRSLGRRSVHLLVFTLLSMLPVGLYYAWFLQGATDRIEPEFLVSLVFWRSWLGQIEYMVGYVALAGALLGVLLLRPGLPRALMAGLWGGYFLFGLVFARHIHTHDYYSLQLIPVIALSLGSLWDSLTAYLRRATSTYYLRATIVGVFLLALALGLAEHRATILLIAQQGRGEAFPGRYVSHAMTADYERRAEVYREIGELVNHSPDTLVLAPDYGYSIAYHGRFDVHFLLPESKKPFKDFAALRAEHSPKYIIVIKRFAHYHVKVKWGRMGKGKNYTALRTLLTRNFAVVANNDTYVVFDSRKTDAGKSKEVR
jgi:hypothetical protein